MIQHGKPQYADDRRMDMTAYMGPRRAGKRNFNGSYGNPRDPKAGFPEFWDDAVFETYKAAGMTYLLPDGDAFYGTRVTENGIVVEEEFEKSDLYRFLTIAEKHGIPVYPSQAELMYILARRDTPMTAKEKDMVAAMVATLKKHFPNTVKGMLLTDEPTMQHRVGMESCVHFVRELAPEWDIFVSMLPIYGTAEMFGADMNDPQFKDKEITLQMKEAEYRKYIAAYGALIGEFSFDYYAFNHDAGPEILSPFFFRNLELAAEGARTGGFPMSATLQAFRMDRRYDPATGKGQPVFRETTYEDVRWQVYAALAFGARRLGYFTFWQHYNESQYEVFPTAMVVYDEAEEAGFRKTGIYYDVKKVNEQVHACDHVLLRFYWKGCRTVVKSEDENIRLVEGNYTDDTLGAVTATRDTLIGCFENPEDGRDGYWLVNAHNPYFYEWSEVEATFTDADRVVYWRAGRECDEPLENGIFRIRLGAGEGVFVIPYKA